MVLSKRSLIHSDSFQSKIKSYLKLFLESMGLKEQNLDKIFISMTTS